MLFNWLMAILSGRPTSSAVRRSDGSTRPSSATRARIATNVPAADRLADPALHDPEASAATQNPTPANGVSYPLRKPYVEPLPSLIRRYLGALDRAASYQRPNRGMTWDRIQENLREAFAATCKRLEPYLDGELGRNDPHQVREILGQLDEAAFLLSAGAWAVGQDDRVTARLDPHQLRAVSEPSLGKIPSGSRQIIEPAISFAHWRYGSLMDSFYASPHGEAERCDRDAHLRDRYHAFALAAWASYQLGLAFEDRASART